MFYALNTLLRLAATCPQFLIGRRRRGHLGVKTRRLTRSIEETSRFLWNLSDSYHEAKFKMGPNAF